MVIVLYRIVEDEELVVDDELEVEEEEVVVLEGEVDWLAVLVLEAGVEVEDVPVFPGAARMK